MPSSVSNTSPTHSFAILSIVGNLLRILPTVTFFQFGFRFMFAVRSGQIGKKSCHRIQLDKLNMLSTFIEFGVFSCGKCNTRDAYYGKRLI